MDQIVIFVLGIIIGGGVVWYFANRKSSQSPAVQPDFIKNQAGKYEENKQKISQFLEGKEKISNNDIEQLLGVSDATATRYLDELEKQGRIRQIGKTGRSVFYTKI